MERLLEKMREPSTYRGLAILATLAGVNVVPGMTEAITAVGLAIVGLIDVVKRG